MIDPPSVHTQAYRNKKGNLLELPAYRTGGTAEQKALPSLQCALSVSYREWHIAGWTMMSSDNATSTWEGRQANFVWGYLNTGVGGCGLYSFNQISKHRSDAAHSGDAIMLRFKFGLEHVP